MSTNPYQAPASTDPAKPVKQDPAILVIRLAGLLIFLYWSYRLGAHLYFWELHQMMESSWGNGSASRLVTGFAGATAGLMMMVRPHKLLVVPLAIHLLGFAIFYFSLTGVPMSIGILLLPEMLAILLAETVIFALAIRLIRKQILR